MGFLLRAWWHPAISGSCLCRRSSSRRNTGVRNKIARVMLRSVGLPSPAGRWWVYLGDDVFACQPIAEAINAVGGNFILTCKPSSHQTIAESLEGADLSEHRETVSKRGKRI